MTVRTAELLMAIATLLMSLGLMLNVYTDELNIGWVEGRGPGAGVWPFWLSAGMALASLATLYRWFRGKTPESRSDAPYIDPETLFLVAVSAASLLGLLILMQIVGTYLSLMIFMVLYVRILGHHSWGTTMAFVIGTPVFVYLLFEVALTKYLPKGLPFFEEGFLFIDNLRYEWFY
ncbi:tripartite tricarboxylate transporter TctB family protein [Tropicimonas marinistellae]|uniref:tripartite tricarboxylate transporter TctB family protein n=1 Tax=Tropicimonas marinistellae TaxID=1739787 RepID=UPI000834B3E5|nr:tripartite tricarboxylate transporter TctB family protein [Tropicimonas marinistellae]